MRNALTALLAVLLCLPASLAFSQAHAGGSDDDPYTFSDYVTIGGDANVIQLKVKGNAAQTADILVCENSAGTDLFAVDKDGNLEMLGTSLATGGDLSLVATATNGNAGAKNEFIGLPRIKLVSLGAGTNGSTETTSYVDDSPTGEYAPVDASVTEAEGSVAGVFRFGASSYAATFLATAVEDDGFKRTITGDDLEADASIGMWLYASEAIASADLQILLTDDGGARNFDIGAIPATTWTWLEVDISSLAAGTGDVVTEFGITLTAQGEAALSGFSLYLDQAWKWAVADEEALGVAVLQDGVLSVVSVATAAGSANTTSDLAEGTAYFTHYETGNDFIVWVTDQSAASAFALIAY